MKIFNWVANQMEENFVSKPKRDFKFVNDLIRVFTIIPEWRYFEVFNIPAQKRWNYHFFQLRAKNLLKFSHLFWYNT